MDWTRIETHTAGAGIPDLSGVFKTPECGINEGFEFWLELKVLQLKTVNLRSVYRPTQIAWQTRRARLGGKVWNLIHHPSSSSMLLIHGGKLSLLIDESTTVSEDLRTSEDDFKSIVEWIRSH